MITYQKHFSSLILIILLLACTAKTEKNSFMQAKTVFQVNNFYDARLAIPSDGVIIHRHGDNLKTLTDAISSWKKFVPCVGRMFFADSDAINEYWTGRWDGKNHADDREVNSAGNVVMCSNIRPYIVPTDDWIEYLKYQTELSIKAGAKAILPEEPLAHITSGYSKSFKKLWKERYNIPWQAESSSAFACYLTGQLQAELFLKLEKEIAKTAKKNNVVCVVPIHSIFGNISSSLSAPLGISVGIKEIDGYIGQIWTGPVNWSLANYISSEKSFFASAYALYDYFTQLTVGTDKKLWLLVDPVEDNPNHSWFEFNKWYEHCIAAMLLMKNIDSYEIMPWPDRIFMPGYQTGGGTPAPENFRMEVLSISQVLQDIQKGGEWLNKKSQYPTERIGIAIADTAMYYNKNVPKLQGLFSLYMPLIMAGVPVSSFVMERAEDKNYADMFKIIILSYSNFKPAKPEMNKGLVSWVKRGGTLVIFDDDVEDELDRNDYFWWQKKGYNSPLKHLLALFHKTKTRKEKWRFGKGTVIRKKIPPRDFAGKSMATTVYLPVVNWALGGSEKAKKLKTPGMFLMKRGDFIIAHSEKKEILRKGKFVNIFNPSLPVINQIILKPGESGLYKDVTEILTEGAKPKVLATTYRLISENYKNGMLIMKLKGPSETPGAARIFFPASREIKVKAIDSKGKSANVEIKKDKETFLIKFPNFPEGIKIFVRKKK